MCDRRWFVVTAARVWARACVRDTDLARFAARFLKIEAKRSRFLLPGGAQGLRITHTLWRARAQGRAFHALRRAIAMLGGGGFDRDAAL